MPDYRKLYVMLFNSITDALRHLENYEFLEAKNLLIYAQQKAEDEYIDND